MVRVTLSSWVGHSSDSLRVRQTMADKCGLLFGTAVVGHDRSRVDRRAYDERERSLGLGNSPTLSTDDVKLWHKCCVKMNENSRRRMWRRQICNRPQTRTSCSYKMLAFPLQYISSIFEHVSNLINEFNNGLTSCLISTHDVWSIKLSRLHCIRVLREKPHKCQYYNSLCFN